MAQMPPDWSATKRIVAEAMEAPAEERRAIIESRTGSDARLRDEVESLVRAADKSQGVLSATLDAWVGIGGHDLSRMGGQRIGRFLIHRLIAEGSTAAVYEATQATPQRKVAIKVLRDALPLMDSTRRFDREVAALGRLDHPNIARIFEAGRHRTDTGRVLPFLAMEFIDGPPITQFVRQHNPPRSAIVELAIKVASAVHAAHQQAIIHRDLKPANVLVDGQGEPKVLDFGIARIIDAEARTWSTSAGLLLGTPGYMSPEQAGGRPDEIDVRTDVWACGVLLYEMLTGRLPIEVANLPLVDVIQRIATADPTPIAARNPALTGDLGIVVMKALARDKLQRYASAQALADDLRRVLSDEPITARQPSTIYRMRKFARRHRGGLGAAAAFLGLVVVATGLLMQSYFSIRRERDRAQAVSGLMRDLVSSGSPQFGNRNAKMVDVLSSAEERMTSASALHPAVEADLRSALGAMYFGLGEYEQSRINLIHALELRGASDAGHDRAALLDQVGLAHALRWLARPEEARVLAVRTLEQAQRALGDADEATIAALDLLAGCDADQQKLDAAEIGYRRSLVSAQQYLGEDHRQTLAILGNLANVLMMRGEYDEAELLYRRCVMARERAGSLQLLDGMTDRHNVANVLVETGRLAEAVPELEQLVAEATMALGPGHDSTLRFFSSLANAHQRAGRGDKSIEIGREILDRRISALGWSHAVTLNECLSYSFALLRGGRHEEALAIVQSALADADAALGADAIVTLRLRLNRAAAQSGLGQFREAEVEYRAGLEALRSKLGEAHQYTLSASNNLGVSLVDAGNGAAAIAILEQTLQTVLSHSLAAMEPTVRRNLGNAYRVAGRFVDAQEQLQTAWRLSEARGERENSRHVAEGLAKLYTAWGRPDDAARWSGSAP